MDKNLGSLTNNWSNNGTEGSLSQKVLRKVKPDTPIKNKIDDAQKKLELQIIKLNTIHEKLPLGLTPVPAKSGVIDSPSM